MLFSTEASWTRYDHIFTLRMNTCFFHLFHDRFCNWYATNTLATSAEITMTITVVWLVILFIGTDATDSDKKNNEYYASHNDS